eukprot:2402983-Amphidinium_carterae.1
MLAWCARFGVKSSARRQLGKHSDPRDKSMLIYSRASMAALSPVAEASPHTPMELADRVTRAGRYGRLVAHNL